MKQYKGFVSFDLLFAALPLLLMLSYLSTVIFLATETANSEIHSNEVEVKLTTIADYLVKRGAVERTEQENSYLGIASYRPNVIDEEYLSGFQQSKEKIKNWMELNSLSVSWSPAEGVCVYRLVLYHEEIRTLYVCGD